MHHLLLQRKERISKVLIFFCQNVFSSSFFLFFSLAILLSVFQPGARWGRESRGNVRAAREAPISNRGGGGEIRRGRRIGSASDTGDAIASLAAVTGTGKMEPQIALHF